MFSALLTVVKRYESLLVEHVGSACSIDSYLLKMLSFVQYATQHGNRKKEYHLISVVALLDTLRVEDYMKRSSFNG